MKIGEYIRTCQGDIGKVAAVTSTGIIIEDERHIHFDRITKHSSNIIDVIEAGDYVNGWKVRGKTSKKVVVDYYMYSEQLGEGQWLTFYKDNIKSIVTHESFNSIKYEVI